MSSRIQGSFGEPLDSLESKEIFVVLRAPAMALAAPAAAFSDPGYGIINVKITYNPCLTHSDVFDRASEEYA